MTTEAEGQEGQAVAVAASGEAEARREEVRAHYAAVALSTAGGCCQPGTGPAGLGCYSAEEQLEIPAGAAQLSLGCGAPVAVAQLRPGERALDLGSGGGADVLLSARRVGESGFVYGLDMTDEMLALARANAAASGVTNVAFLKGTIEDVPLPDESVDVVISNCVINLSVDKPAVFAEVARVLVPGGRLSVSDIVAEDGLGAEVRAQRGSYVGCVAGALSRSEYLEALARVGLVDGSVRFTHEVVPGMHAAIVQATKPPRPS